jgi:hypothetical protein
MTSVDFFQRMLDQSNKRPGSIVVQKFGSYEMCKTTLFEINTRKPFMYPGQFKCVEGLKLGKNQHYDLVYN